MGSAVLLVLLAASTWSMLGNLWSHDDIPIIATNSRVHSLGGILGHWTTSYWPPPFPTNLYRPIVSVMFNVQWAIGGGSPLAFKIFSLLLYAVTCFATWRLLARLLPAWFALAMAALFVVHPVHVEAVAVGVNQAELWVGLLSCLIVCAWLNRRLSGAPIGGPWLAGIIAAFGAALLCKENAAMIPLIVVAAELTVLRTQRAAPFPIARARLAGLGTLAVALAVLYARTLALGGDAKGSFTAEALIGATASDRALTMLGVVREWTRLLIWPSHLRADYSPSELLLATSFGPAQAVGVFIMLAAIGLIVLAWKRAPAISFGMLWLGLSLAPVHNVLVPTGIVIAERTLFLGSIGFLIACGGALHFVLIKYRRRIPRYLSALAAIGFGVLLICGTTRSMSRYPVWKTPYTLWEQSLIDAPSSWRVLEAAAESVYWPTGRRKQAELLFRRAIEMNPGSWSTRILLADKYRLSGKCGPAIPLYLEALDLVPQRVAARASLIACYLWLGDYSLVPIQARLAASYGGDPVKFARDRITADSALRVGAPPGTVYAAPVLAEKD